MRFKDLGAIEGEPETDVRIVTESGLDLRERMVEFAANADAALLASASPTARSLVISNALLAPDGSVERDGNRRPRLSSRHEVVLTNEALGRLGSVENLEEVIRDAREVAAALADMEFRGMRLFDQVIIARIRPPARIDGD